MKEIQPISTFYQDIRQLIEQARTRVKVAVNFTMVDLYWSIGKRIVEEEQGGESRAEYGKALINQLSKQLFVDIGEGYSVSNLKYFRQFYLSISNSPRTAWRIGNGKIVSNFLPQNTSPISPPRQS